MAQLLITGGTGFIGSHACLVLLQAGHGLVVLDNFSNSSPVALDRVKEIAGNGATARLTLIKGDIRTAEHINQAFASTSTPIEAVIHFAGLKAVSESVQKPLTYWDVNVAGSRTLLASMLIHGCRTIVFSSSATIYGYPETVPIPETAKIQPINPYGHSKAAVEQMLSDIAASGTESWRIASLRYFNPVGAHPSGRIGEAPLCRPNNLFPLINQVASGRREKLHIFGSDWPTPDGTCIRDYIHVMDLAEGHCAAVDTLLSGPPQHFAVNLGSGVGTSVLEVSKAYSAASGRVIPYELRDRRPGDSAISLADPSLAAAKLNWRTRRCLEEMCRDSWTWQQNNPFGYG